MNAPHRIFERTLGKTVEVTGIGLHSGRPVRVRLRPGKAGEGIVFYRSDLPGGERRPIRCDASGVTGPSVRQRLVQELLRGALAVGAHAG